MTSPTFYWLINLILFFGWGLILLVTMLTPIYIIVSLIIYFKKKDKEGFEISGFLKKALALYFIPFGIGIILVIIYRVAMLFLG